MKKLTLALIALMFLSTTSLYAQEASIHFDPYNRNLMFVEGQAELSVPVNGFSLAFSYDVEKSSFSDVTKESIKIKDKIANGVKSLGLTNVEIIHGWDLVRQARISLSSKGRKITNRLVVRVVDFPQGKLQELIAAIIDKGIEADGAVALEEIQVFISDKRENEKKEELMQQALKALNSNAEQAASSLGRKVTEPKRVYVTNEMGIMQEAAVYSDMQNMAMSKAAFISVQRSFKVNTEIADYVKLSARVSGVYELA